MSQTSEAEIAALSGAVVAARKAAGGGDFWRLLAAELLADCYRFEPENTDELRFGTAPNHRLKDFFLRLAAGLGFYRSSRINDSALRCPELGEAFDLLADERSKELFVKLVAYHLLGERRVRLPLNTPAYGELRQSIDTYLDPAAGPGRRGAVVPGGLNRYNVNGVRLTAGPLNILNTFLLDQYSCPRASIGVLPADIVIDGGGCWGDTALQFARHAERVFCFECIPSNLKVIGENLVLNSDLASRITVVERALGERSGEKMFFADTGPGSRATDNGTVEVRTQTIDDFARENALSRVDFIKMDIEGAEPAALAGARETLIRCRPRLAISIYHDIAHFASIPLWLNSLNLGYRFYVDHFTIHREETVLFAAVR